MLGKILFRMRLLGPRFAAKVHHYHTDGNRDLTKGLRSFLTEHNVAYIIRRPDILSEPSMIGFWTERDYAIYMEAADDNLAFTLHNGHRDRAVDRLRDLNIQFDLARYDEVRLFRQIDMVVAKLALTKVPEYTNTYTLDD
jgi:hypothetical protein